MGVLVGRKAPEFQVKAVVNGHIVDKFSLNQFQNKYVIFFFYPLDFTFVCPTELHAFQEAEKEFAARNAVVVGCSIDSAFCHLAWLNTPKNKGGIQGITYPLVSDLNKTICRDYDVLVPQEGIAYRALFLLDKSGVIRHQIVNDLPLGRSVEEALRVLDALIHTEKHGEVCPANWNPGKRAMKATAHSVQEYLATV